MNLLDLYIKMLRIRRIEEEITLRYHQQEMRCPVHLSIGQEAIAVGVCSLLRQKDLLFSNHRAHAHYLAKGGDLKAMIAEIYGKESGCCKGRGGSMHLIDLSQGILGTTPIVGGTLPVAVGAAFASYLREENIITCVFTGEGATEEGVFGESLNFASLYNLPILFICENNLYSVYSPMNVRQSENRSRIGIAAAHGIKGHLGFGNDIEEVYTMTAEAIDHLEKGKGPVFLEFTTYRYREHCGPNFDNTIGYRTEEEYKTWLEKCPIHLLRKKIDVDDEKIEKMIQKEVEEAFLHAKNAPFAKERSFSNELFAPSFSKRDTTLVL